MNKELHFHKGDGFFCQDQNSKTSGTFSIEKYMNFGKTNGEEGWGNMVT